VNNKLDEWQLYLLARRQVGVEPNYKPQDAVSISTLNLDKRMTALKAQCSAMDDLTSNGAIRRNARNACREVIDLYGDESGDIFKKHVADAKRWLEEVKKLDA